MHFRMKEDIWNKDGTVYQPKQDSRYKRLIRKPINTLTQEEIKYIFTIHWCWYLSNVRRFDYIEDALENTDDRFSEEYFKECYDFLHSLSFPLKVYRAVRDSEHSNDGFTISGKNASYSWSTNINIYKDATSKFRNCTKIVSCEIDSNVIDVANTINNFIFYTSSYHDRGYGEYEITLKPHYSQNDLHNLQWVDKDTINEKIEHITFDEDSFDYDGLFVVDSVSELKHFLNTTNWKEFRVIDSSDYDGNYYIGNAMSYIHADVLSKAAESGWFPNHNRMSIHSMHSDTDFIYIVRGKDKDTGMFGCDDYCVKYVFDDYTILTRDRSKDNKDIIKKFGKLLDLVDLIGPSDNDLLDNQGNELTTEQMSFFKGSAIRDNNGRLLVCHHRTDADFDSFDKQFFGSSGGTDFGYGFYFSVTDKDWYGANDKQCYLNITKPFYLDVWSDSGRNRLYSLLNGSKFSSAVNEHKDNAANLVDNYGGAGFVNMLIGQEELTNLCVSKGFDGIIVADLIDGEIIAFEPNQIKYITNRTPTSSNNLNEDVELKESKETRSTRMRVKKLNESSGKYYVTTYTETSYSGPEEGGYTSYGWEAQSSKPFNSFEEAQAFQQEWLSGDEIINDDGKGRIRAIDDYGDNYLVIIETDETRGSEHAPARSWAESEFGVEHETPFFDASGKRLPEDPAVTAKRDADRNALQKELETSLVKAKNDEEAMRVWFDDKFTSIRKDNTKLFTDKMVSFRKSVNNESYTTYEDGIVTQNNGDRFTVTSWKGGKTLYSGNSFEDAVKCYKDADGCGEGCTFNDASGRYRQADVNHAMKSNLTEMTIAYDENTIKRMISKLEKEIEDYKALINEEPEDKDFWQKEMDKCQAEIDELKSYKPLEESAKDWADDKELTYDEAMELAKAYYSQGGDGFFETTDRASFDYMVKEFGPMTVRKLKRDFGVFDGVAKDRMEEAYNIKFYQIFKSPEKPTENGKMVAQCSTEEEAHEKGKKLCGEGKYLIKAVCDDGKTRYLESLKEGFGGETSIEFFSRVGRESFAGDFARALMNELGDPKDIRFLDYYEMPKGPYCDFTVRHDGEVHTYRVHPGYVTLRESTQRRKKGMKIIKESVLTEAPADSTVPFKLPKNMLNNPNSIDLKGMASQAVRDKEAAEAEAKRQAEFEANSQKYAELINTVKNTSGVEQQLEVLFNELVPSNGKADTVAGELVRAIMRIMYRDYNDGDVFYEGYGLETCSSSVAYLIDAVDSPKIYDSFYRIADSKLEDDSYTRAIDKIGEQIVSYILSNKSVWQPNNEDSRSASWEQVYERDYKEDWEPTYDYDFMIPPTIAEHMNNGNCTDEEFADEIRSELDNSGIEYDSVEVWSDYVYIYGLKRDDYDELERRGMYDDSSWDWFIDNLNDQYGDPYADDDDEEDEDDED